MVVDSRYGNSSGYFKDPITGEDLSVDTERVVPCSFENGKFTWPCVMRSDGEQLLKIVYKLFTDEEKELYKQYRGRTGESRPRQPSKPKQPKSPSTKEPEISDKEVIKYDKDSAVTLKTLETLAVCDRLYGVSQIAGLTYALVGAYDSNRIYHIPRSLIPDSEFERLSDGVNYSV